MFPDSKRLFSLIFCVVGPSIGKWPGIIVEVSLVRIFLHLDELLVLNFICININYGLDTGGIIVVNFLMPKRRIKPHRIERALIFIYLGCLSEPLQRIKMLMFDAAAWVSFALGGGMLIVTVRLNEIILSLPERIVAVVEVHIRCSTDRRIRIIAKLNWCHILQSFRQISRFWNAHSLDKEVWKLHVMVSLYCSFVSLAYIMKPLKIILLFLIKRNNLRILIMIYLFFEGFYLELQRTVVFFFFC